MFTKIDKAWVTGLVAFIAMSASTFFGFELSDTLQAGIASAVLAIVTWAVPNKQ